MILIGPDPETVRELPDRMRKKAVCVSLQESLQEFLEDSRINQTTNRNLYSFLSGRLYSSQPS